MTTAAQTRAPLAFPTKAELEAAKNMLSEATSKFARMRWSVWQLADANEEDRRVPGDAVPTLDDVGRLFSFGVDARERVEELGGYVDALADLVRDVDSVRLHEEGDDDA